MFAPVLRWANWGLGGWLDRIRVLPKLGLSLGCGMDRVHMYVSVLYRVEYMCMCCSVFTVFLSV